MLDPVRVRGENIPIGFSGQSRPNLRYTSSLPMPRDVPVASPSLGSDFSRILATIVDATRHGIGGVSSQQVSIHYDQYQHEDPREGATGSRQGKDRAR